MTYTATDTDRELADLVLYVVAVYRVKINRPLASRTDRWVASPIKDAEYSGGSVADLNLSDLLYDLGVEPENFATAVRAAV